MLCDYCHSKKFLWSKIQGYTTYYAKRGKCRKSSLHRTSDPLCSPGMNTIGSGRSAHILYWSIFFLTVFFKHSRTEECHWMRGSFPQESSPKTGGLDLEVGPVLQVCLGQGDQKQPRSGQVSGQRQKISLMMMRMTSHWRIPQTFTTRIPTHRESTGKSSNWKRRPVTSVSGSGQLLSIGFYTRTMPSRNTIIHVIIPLTFVCSCVPSHSRTGRSLVIITEKSRSKERKWDGVVVMKDK